MECTLHFSRDFNTKYQGYVTATMLSKGCTLSQCYQNYLTATILKVKRLLQAMQEQASELNLDSSEGL